jgi:hypothetical protein
MDQPIYCCKWKLVFGGHIIYVNIPHRKEERNYAYYLCRCNVPPAPIIRSLPTISWVAHV